VTGARVSFLIRVGAILLPSTEVKLQHRPIQIPSRIGFEGRGKILKIFSACSQHVYLQWSPLTLTEVVQISKIAEMSVMQGNLTLKRPTSDYGNHPFCYYVKSSTFKNPKELIGGQTTKQDLYFMPKISRMTNSISILYRKILCHPLDKKHPQHCLKVKLTT